MEVQFCVQLNLTNMNSCSIKHGMCDNLVSLFFSHYLLILIANVVLDVCMKIVNELLIQCSTVPFNMLYKYNQIKKIFDSYLKANYLKAIFNKHEKLLISFNCETKFPKVTKYYDEI